MDARLQRRVQRYGWDLAAADYERLWHGQLAPAQQAMLEAAQLQAGERVLDVACGTGIVSFAAARAVAPGGDVLGVDLSGRMVEAAQRRASLWRTPGLRFARMDAEALELPDASVDVVLCALGLMYLPDVRVALREMRRVLRPGGRLALAVWGERAGCGWAEVFAIVDAEVRSDVCPLFFQLGQAGSLAGACADAGFVEIGQRRLQAALAYADGEDACAAAFVGGPVALAWSRFDGGARERVCRRYLEAIDRWRDPAAGATAYRLPGEFVIVHARR